MHQVYPGPLMSCTFSAQKAIDNGSNNNKLYLSACLSLSHSYIIASLADVKIRLLAIAYLLPGIAFRYSDCREMAQV